jgi:hypothetical protein
MLTREQDEELRETPGFFTTAHAASIKQAANDEGGCERASFDIVKHFCCCNMARATMYHKTTMRLGVIPLQGQRPEIRTVAVQRRPMKTFTKSTCDPRGKGRRVGRVGRV